MTAPTRSVVRPSRVVAVATAVAAGLVAFRLGDKSIWVDEAFTISHARQPADEFFDVLVTREANAALHTLLEFALVRVSDAEWWLRLPSAIGFVATVPLTYLLVRRLFGDRVACFASVLVSVNAFALEYGQQARTYALFMAAATLSTWLFVRYVQDGGDWAMWVVSAGVLGYFHLFGVLVVASQFVASFLIRPGDRRGTRLLAGFVVAGALSLPLAIFVLVHGDEGQAVGVPGLTPIRVLGVFVRLAGNGHVVLATLVAAAAMLAFVVVRPDRERRTAMSTRSWGLLLLTTVLVLPVLVVAALAPVLSLFGSRYFITGVPALAGITALGISLIDRDAVRTTLAAGTVVVGVVAIGYWFAREPVEDVDTALAELAPTFEDGDGVVFVPYFMRLPFNAYVEEYGELERLDLVWPRTDWGELNEGHPDFADPVDYERATEYDRVWVVVRDDILVDEQESPDGFVDSLEREHDLALDRDYPGFTVLRYDR